MRISISYQPPPSPPSDAGNNGDDDKLLVRLYKWRANVCAWPASRQRALDHTDRSITEPDTKECDWTSKHSFHSSRELAKQKRKRGRFGESWSKGPIPLTCASYDLRSGRADERILAALAQLGAWQSFKVVDLHNSAGSPMEARAIVRRVTVVVVVVVFDSVCRWLVLFLAQVQMESELDWLVALRCRNDNWAARGVSVRVLWQFSCLI